MPDISFVTATGKESSTHKVLDKDTFFMVLRYIGCTICRYDVHLLETRYHEFKRKNAQVFVVMQSSPGNVMEDVKEKKLPFEIICDPELVFYKELGIPSARDVNELAPPEVMDALMEKIGKAASLGIVHGKYEGIEEQLPAMFLVGKDRKIKYANYARNIIDNPGIAEMLGML